jgi:hypothetical protein
MRELLASIFRLFKKPDPQKPVEAWPFPTEEAIKKAKECCGGCDKPAKKKPAVKKATTRKPAVKKPAVIKAKKAKK